MPDCSCLYSGFVSHTRHVVPGSSAASNTFKYPVMYFYLDLDCINETFSKIPFVSINRHNILSWFRKDYIGSDNSTISLCDYVKDLVELHCNQRPDANGKVCLLTLPTQFGYGFNPVSIFYCFNEENTKIQAIVAEVHNTPWLETHCYVLPFFDNEREDVSLYTAQWTKAFHVSPFYTMQYDYVWSFGNPNDTQREFRSFGSLLRFRKTADRVEAKVKVHSWGTSSLAKAIELKRDWMDRGRFIKAFNFGFKEMERMEINRRNVFRFVLKFPVICCVIQLWIHWQAVKVYWKGISVKRHPRDEYVNPLTFWVKHTVIFVLAFFGIMVSWIPFMFSFL